MRFGNLAAGNVAEGQAVLRLRALLAQVLALVGGEGGEEIVK
jgi:hypothetical protein